MRTAAPAGADEGPRSSAPRISGGRGAVLAAVLLTFAFGAFFALQSAPWGPADETAHTGYLLSLTKGEIPTLDTPILQPRGAGNLGWRIGLAAPAQDGSAPRQQTWVANHPPGAYLPAVPGGWWASRTGQGNQVLLWQRLSNVVGGALLVGITALLARELSGRSEVGVIAAGITAAAPYVAGITSTGLTDGLSLAAVVATIWATARAIRLGFDRSAATVVAAGAVACGLTRLSSLLVAVAVVGTGLVVHAARHRTLPSAAALGIAASVAATSGWFYVANVVRYGDPAASSELLDRFDRSPRGSWFEIVTSWAIWEDAIRKVLTTYRGDPSIPGFFVQPPPAPQLASTAAMIVVALAAVVVTVDLLRTPGSPPEPPVTRDGPNRWGWVLVPVAIAVVFTTTAQHVAGGGLSHPRYLLLLIPAAACAIAHSTWVFTRRGGRNRRLLGLVPVLALLGLHARALPEAMIIPGLPLRGWDPTLGGRGAQFSLLALAGLGLVTYLVSAAACLRRSPPVGPRPRSAPGA